ncbi:MAG: DUF167 family protein [Nitrospira sp.]|nr:DUF167 family protein [Nitrospira sp.]
MIDGRCAIVSEGVEEVVLRVYVQPKADRTECVGLHGDAFKIRVAAPPVDGLANEELIRFLSDRCKVRKNCLTIQSGMASRQKRVRIVGVSAQWVLDRLIPVHGRGGIAS